MGPWPDTDGKDGTVLALVTGGQGFIGSHLCERLLADGHRVRVLARPDSDPANLRGLPCEWVLGDLLQAEGLGQAVAGADWVFHLAAALKGFRESDLMRVNGDGTLHLVRACRKHAPGLRRFVLVSSLAAAGPCQAAQPRPEDAPARPLTWYGRSKLVAEMVVRASGLPAVILRPPVVFGPRDRELLGSFRCARSGWLPVPRGGRRYSLLYAPDLAEALLRAAQAPCPTGTVLPLAGPDLTWAEFGQRMATALGRPVRSLPLPDPWVRAAGLGADLWARLRGRPGIFSSQKVLEILAPGWVADPEPARRALDWVAATPLDTALAATVAWYRDHGWL